MIDKLFFGELEEVFPVDDEPSRRRAVKAADHVQQRGFPATAVSDYRHQLALFDRQVEALQSKDLKVFRLVYLDEILTLDDVVDFSH